MTERSNLVLVFFITLSFLVVYHIQEDISTKFEEYCNSKYGENWTVIAYYDWHCGLGLCYRCDNKTFETNLSKHPLYNF